MRSAYSVIKHDFVLLRLRLVLTFAFEGRERLDELSQLSEKREGVRVIFDTNCLDDVGKGGSDGNGRGLIASDGAEPRARSVEQGRASASSAAWRVARASPR